jgi:ABC-type transport system involved in cytochrome bd biosynthesis fused ATPase/permease subunit
MQLNSITIMDLIAYGGAALGVILAVIQFTGGKVSLQGCLLIILLAADFFIPMRQLGSYFHIAMNGMAASDKIFRLLDLPEQSQEGKQEISDDYSIVCQNVSFSYEEDREVLHDVDMRFPMGSFTAIVGESGCGKSTVAAVLMGRNKDYTGSVTVGKMELTDVAEESLMKNLTYVSHQSYLFKGTVRDNLLMGKPDAADEELWSVLTKTRLADFMKSEDGLETRIQERGSNLSGGQCQRLALARALLHDSPVYIFDEATSNIDVESENDIMEQIHKLAEVKTVILISHRLANVAGADHIYVMERGCVVENGTHEELLAAAGAYQKLWTAQQELENYVGKEDALK